MKRIRIFLVMLASMVGCDPGIAIRQRKPSAPSVTKTDLNIAIETSDLLIAEKRYFPRIAVTNQSLQPSNITAIELATVHETYANHPRQPNTYPVMLAGGATERLDVMFDLSEPVNKAFKEPAELRVHYTIGRLEQTAAVTLEGGHLR